MSILQCPGLQRGASPDRSDLVATVCAAQDGDEVAWASLVRRFDRRLRLIAHSHGLAACEVDDVVQATWLAAVEDIGRLREPAAIAGWLATTARRTAIRAAQGRRRESPSDDPQLGDRPDPVQPEHRLLQSERRDVLDRAVATLPDRHRRLMSLLVGEPTLDYTQIARMLAMPAGSIGPIRGRCLERLKRHPEVRALCETVAS